MSSLRVESQVDPSSWNASLASCHGNVFHTTQWATYVQAEQPGACPVFYSLLGADGSVTGMALGFRARSSYSLAAPFTGRQWLNALPAMRNNAHASAGRFIRLIESNARGLGDASLQVGSFASPNSEEVVRPLGFSVSRRYEFELDLTKDDKSVWESIDVRRRQRIQKAIRNGVEVKELTGADGAAHLRRLQAASWVRVVARGGGALDEREFHGQDPIAILMSSGLGRTIGGFVDGVCSSASFFTSFNGTAYYTLSGHDDRALKAHAPSLVLWEMAKRFRSEGVGKLNLGGCGVTAVESTSSEHGVYGFKKAFGGQRLECASGEKVLRPVVSRIVDLLKGAMR